MSLKKWKRSLLSKFFVNMEKLRVVSEQHIKELQESHSGGIKKKEELACNAKGMRTLDTLFGSTKKLTSIFLLQSLKSQSLSPSPSPSFETISNSSLTSEEIIRNLQICLDEISQQCTVTKSVKMNKNIFIYDYLRYLNIRRYI